MFTAFFYLLRSRGLNVSLNEWITLLEGLEKGLHHSSLTGFYSLCRAVVVKNETEYDRFDQVFLEFFQDVPFKGDLPADLLKWLERPSEDLKVDMDKLREIALPDKSMDEILKMLEKRLQEQKSEHNGGTYWVGTQGRSVFGNGGWHPGGIRIGGQGRYGTAVDVAGERRFRDFRKDNTLDIRQFQMAFRSLRQLSAQADSGEKELDIDGTIRATCDHAGTLDLRWRNPRKNTIKVLLLMDSGGSMEHYSNLCSMLFQAATKSNHFQALHTYYFHNCVYEDVYTSPTLRWDTTVTLESLLRLFDDSYRLIVVGDAAMSPHELTEKRFRWGQGSYGPSGMECLLELQRHFPHMIWLNPNPAPLQPNYWNRTHWQLSRMFPMYELSVAGLEAGMKRLIAKRR